MRDTTAEQTEVGSYFVANYPPFSVWTPEAVAAEALPALQRAAVPGTPLGLYLHIPFCRKRLRSIPIWQRRISSWPPCSRRPATITKR